MQVKRDIMWRINVSFILICIMGLLILAQILRIQIVEGDKWKGIAESETVKHEEIEASRGNIYSSDGSLLATSIPIYDIRMDTRAEGLTKEVFDKKVDSLGLCLSRLFKDMSPAGYTQALRDARSQRDRYFLVKRNISYAELQKVKTFPLFRLGRYKGGLRVEAKETRELPFRMLALRTLGYMRDVKPVGIESSFNNDLQGVNGERVVQKLSGNVWMPVSDKAIVEPKDGNDIYTTIDINIQGVAENSLERQLREQNADHGCAILMEVETGEIKAIANLSRTSEGKYIEDFNYAISESTEPGSTMKMASLLAALDDGLINPNDTVDVGNGICFYSGYKMEDAHPPHSSRLSIQQAFESSSNVGISKAIKNAYVKRPQQFIDKLKSFGLSDKLGLQIEGEGTPFLKSTSDKSWSALSLPWISIGYESSLTPLQILSFYNAIANNGNLVKPRFVKEVRNHGEIIKSFPVKILRDSIASPEALMHARKMMEGVVQNGTASALNKSPYKIAGKTGTAQISKDKNGYNKQNKSYQASFVGYFPADAPKYSCIVVVNSPSNNLFYGGAVAAPVFKEIADKVYANHLDMHGTPMEFDSSKVNVPLAKAGSQNELKKLFRILGVPYSSKDDDASVVSVNTARDKVVFNPRNISTTRVPDVKGMGARNAIFILENSGLRVVCNGKGSVVSQSIQPGKEFNKGQLITIHLDI